MMNIYIFIILIIGVGNTVRASNYECEETLKNIKTRHLNNKITLYEIQYRWIQAHRKLISKGIQRPNLLGNVFAIRFIKVSDWSKYLQKNEESMYSAWMVYKPAPLTFGSWVEASQFVDNMASNQPLKIGDKSTQEILDWVREIHYKAMKHMPKNSSLSEKDIGRFREVAEITPLRNSQEAYSETDINSIQHSAFISSKSGRPLLNFTPQKCQDHEKSVLVKRDSASFYFKAIGSKNKSILKSCGDLALTPTEEVSDQMNNWAIYFKHGLKKLMEQPESMDQLIFAARLQQWLVIIHPFIDGNGRVSRLIMDYIFESLNLPPPILDDVERDFFENSYEWANLVGRGLINSVKHLEDCAENLAHLGCHPVSTNLSILNLNQSKGLDHD